MPNNDGDINSGQAKEQSRLDALHAYNILDTPQELMFDEIAKLASYICGTPISAISLVDADRQWFKASVGLSKRETPRDISFCQHVVATGDVFVVPNALQDDRFKNSPLVQGDPNVRFYAGAPLTTPDGHTLGALCVNDTKPRELSDEQISALRCLANQVVTQMELRIQNETLAKSAVALDIARSEANQATELAQYNLEKLTAVQERYQAILSSTLEAAITVDETGSIVGWDGRAAQMLGRESDEVLGFSMAPLFFPALHLPDEIKSIGSHIENEEGIPMYRVEVLATHSSGVQITVELTMAETELRGHKAYILFLKDLTEKLKVESALNDSEELFRLHVEQAADSFFLVDHLGHICTANEASSRSLGYTRSELMSMSITEIEVGIPAEHVLTTIQAGIPGQVETVEGLQRRKDGSIFPVEVRLSWFMRNGKPHVIAISRDISERQKAVEALRKSEERFTLVARATEDVVWDVQLGSGEVWWSENYYTLFAPEAINHEPTVERWKTRIHPDDLQAVLESFDRALASGGDQWNCEYRYRRADNVYANVFDRAFIIRDSDGAATRMIGALCDITSRKKAASEEQAREHAERANKAKSEFLSRMSHELRTPLNAVIGFAQLLDMRDATPKQKEYIVHILKAGKHLLDMINEVLDLSRIESGTLPASREPVGLEDVFEEAMGIIRPMSEKSQITVRTPIGLARAFVMADRQRILQVVINLLSNAIKYNRVGGWVEIDCHRVGEQVRLIIKDSGVGISEDLFDRVFMPFDRLGAETCSAIEGTGLGLAVSKSLVESMGGMISLESTVNVGSVFSVTLPAAECPMVTCQEELLTMDRIEAKKAKRILYVEDNLSNVLLMQHIMQTVASVELEVARTGQEGIDLAGATDFDMVLLDLDLPDMSGIDVLSWLKQNPGSSHIPVLVVSADANPSRISRLLQAGAAAYVVKPFDIQDLLDQVLDEEFERGNAVA